MNLKSVCLLLSLFHASSAIALGLGELSVRSHLGQALHVTVKILGTNTTTAAGCFSLAPAEGAAVPPPRAQLSLDQGNGQALLHIRTTYTVNDPVAQFSLISDCESRLRRDYVVLLDPPEREAPVLLQEVPAATTQAKVARAEPPPPTSRSPNKPKLKRASPPRPSDSSTQASPPRKQTAPNVQEPRLVLSGRHGANSAALALRLDTNLPDMNRPHANNLTPDELSDENTALTRKLAHLEAQLVDLQKRNTEIEKKRTGVSTTHAPNRFTLPAQWPLTLLITGLLVTAGILVVWLRQRGTYTKAAPRSSMSAASLPDFDDMTADSWTEPVPKPRIAEPGVHERSTTLPESERILEFEPSSPEQTTEINDGILDQAEVYMAHGHSELAVQLLQEHLREAPDESPVPWLLLLDLLHRKGDTAGYAAASTECRRHFNVNLSDHPISQDSETRHGLEAYPHILEHMLKIWGSPDIDDFFKDLLFDNRGGTRIGFDPIAYHDILLWRSVARGDQAEVYMAHGHSDRAVQLLQEYLREAPDESPVPWLLLLDLLHREGDTAGYAAASAECRRHFNIDLSSHPFSQDRETRLGLEAYPHILEQMLKVWGSPDIDDFFKDLLFDNRGGTRIGFDPIAYHDILLWRSVARSVARGVEPPAA